MKLEKIEIEFRLRWDLTSMKEWREERRLGRNILTQQRSSKDVLARMKHP